MLGLGLVGRSSNIFLSAGQLDPWRAGGIAESDLPKDKDPSIEVWININVRLLCCAALRLARLSLSVVFASEQGAHHLDLRASNPLDPPSVTECRVRELAAIRRWVAQWKENPPKPTDP